MGAVRWMEKCPSGPRYRPEGMRGRSNFPPMYFPSPKQATNYPCPCTSCSLHHLTVRVQAAVVVSHFFPLGRVRFPEGRTAIDFTLIQASCVECSILPYYTPLAPCCCSVLLFTLFHCAPFALTLFHIFFVLILLATLLSLHYTLPDSFVRCEVKT